MKPVAAVVLALVAVMGMAAMPVAHAADADDVAFDTTFLRADPKETIDMSRFARGNVVTPGVYPADIWVNDTRVSRDNVRFVGGDQGGSARPCFSRKALEVLGIDFAKLGAQADAAGGDCLDLSAIVPGARADFDFTEQKLSLSVPQKYMRNAARGYVSPELWQQGVTAGFLSYNANTFRTSGAGMNSTQSYIGLNAGVNVGGWHFRNQSSVTSTSGQGTRFNEIATYVQHDVEKLQSQVTLGDAYTTGDVFDSVAFRGAQIATDDRMLPESQRGYAPVVRGTAQSNARVTVRQSGQVIYETNVAPGPFEITDLYATGYGGNLDVTVTEANGRTSSFSVPYASVTQSLRPGAMRFSATAGQLRNDTLQNRPKFAQFTAQRGLTNLFTVYGGGIAADGYTAANTGVALNTSYGAFSSDVTAARTVVPGQDTQQGASLRLGYSKFIAPTHTNVTVAAYRYSTAGYLGMADAASVRDLALQGRDINAVQRQRGRLQLTLSQDFKEYGSLYVSASSQQYWNRDGSDTFFQVGYNNSFKYGTYGISAGRTRDARGQMQNQIMASVTIPLGRGQHAPLLTTNASKIGGASSTQANLSGTAGDENQYSYNAYGTYANAGAGTAASNAGVSGVYRGEHAQVTASASAGSGSNQVSAGVSGSIVAHPGGVTFSQTVGDTFGVIHAPGAAGASIPSVPGVKVDGRGYAVVPYLTPYGMNTVDIDPKGTSSDVEFESTSETAVPRQGSVVMMDYKTVSGRAALIRAPQADGKALPFGADVVDGAGHTVGVVAQDSQIFARGIEDKGAVFVKWGDAAGEQCRVDYALPTASAKAAAGYASVQARCVPGAFGGLSADAKAADAKG
ncbi:fimbria/pilus outer membrane usher protein [Variovorax robiniae]|uniref:Fimbria/pilus outer membrane usher protein n=1 Tax=Variovorax robiniae TaxID=1836199 RepID=A0ABU8X9Q8_9BURK